MKNFKLTSNYAALEVTQNSEYNEKADISSLGVILSEIFNIDMNGSINIYY